MPTIKELDKEIAGMQRNIERLENVLIAIADLPLCATPIYSTDIKRILKENKILG